MAGNLIIGSSHALYLSEAVGTFQANWDVATSDVIEIATRSGAETSVLYALTAPPFVEFRTNSNGITTAALGPLIDKALRFNDSKSKVIFSIGGNEHNAAFMYANPVPFDFFEPKFPEMDSSRQTIPLAEMKDILRRRLSRSQVAMRLAAQRLPAARCYYLTPPPPIPSAEQIGSQPEIFDFSKRPVESKFIRLKIYNVYVELMSIFCSENGILFIPPQSENCDESGFLLDRFWLGCTHATPEYYSRIVEELGL